MKGGVIPFLWFGMQAEEAARYYTSIFPGAKMGEIQRFPAGGISPEGAVMTASFEINGQQIVALNGNKRHAFSPASSLLVFCKDAAEAEAVTASLSAGGERQPGGWLKDRYGVSWQVGIVVPV
jgi:predicted 3-demethylubiquinone-9 3-methyltransferase (glyoxalase superfamily)